MPITPIAMVIALVIFCLNSTTRFSRKAIEYSSPVFIIFFIFVIALRDIGADNYAYINIYYSRVGSDFIFSLFPTSMENKLEVGFYDLVVLLKALELPHQFLFGFVGCFFLLSFFFLIYKKFDRKLATFSVVILFFTYTFYQLNFNQIRQGLAVSFCLWATYYLMEGRWKPFVLFVYIASLYHVTALFFLVSWFLRYVTLTKTKFYFSFVLILLLSMFGVGRIALEHILSPFIPISVASKIDFYLYTEAFSRASNYNLTYLLNISGLLVSGIVYFKLLKSTNKNKSIELLFKLVLFGYLTHSVFSDFVILAQRLLYYYDVFFPVIFVYILISLKNNNVKYGYYLFSIVFFLYGLKTIFSSTLWGA